MQNSKKLWKSAFTLEQLNSMGENSIHRTLGLEFTGFGDDFIEATLPVDARTHQPMGLLHGGASAVLAESLGSIASVLVCNTVGSPLVAKCVGVELNMSHLRAVKDGKVIGRVRPIRIGMSLHVWEISVSTLGPKPFEVSRGRLTVMILQPAGTA